MLVLWVIVGVVVWYGLGMLGSAIGLGGMYRRFHITERDGRSGYLMALGGVLNLIVAIIFCLTEGYGIKPEWYWIK